MKYLKIYLKDYKRDSILAPLFKMLEAMFDLLVPVVVAHIINVGIANQDRGDILRSCGILVLMAIVGLCCSFTAQYFAARAAIGSATGLRHMLFAHIQKLGFSEMDTIGTSTLITRMTSDINQVQNGLNLFLRLFLRSPFIVFGAMVMAFTINVKIALIFVVTIPVLSVIIFGIMAITSPLYKKVQGKLDVITGNARENLSGIRVIRVGLHASPSLEQDLLAGAYNPAFRELCEGERLLTRLLRQLAGRTPGPVTLVLNPRDRSAFTGPARRNLSRLSALGWQPRLAEDPSHPRGSVIPAFPPDPDRPPSEN